MQYLQWSFSGGLQDDEPEDSASEVDNLEDLHGQRYPHIDMDRPGAVCERSGNILLPHETSREIPKRFRKPNGWYFLTCIDIPSPTNMN
jgi:hypothetical protein